MTNEQKQDIKEIRDLLYFFTLQSNISMYVVFAYDWIAQYVTDLQNTYCLEYARRNLWYAARQEVERRILT